MIPRFATGPATLTSAVLVEMGPDGAWVPRARRRCCGLSDDTYEALARTALLLELDIFGVGADHHRIIDGLRATTARITSNRANLASPASRRRWSPSTPNWP